MLIPTYLRLLAVPVFAATLSAAPVVVVDEIFETPTEIMHVYPPPQGEQPMFHHLLSGWATDGGSLAITYGDRYGKNDSGGMLAMVRSPSPKYMVMQYGPMTLPLHDLSYVTVEQIEQLKVSLDVKSTLGRPVELYFSIRTPKDMASRIWGSRLVLGKIVGTGDFVNHTISATAASAQSRRSFSRLIQDLGLNGASELKVDLIFHFSTGADSWKEGDMLQFDNLKVTLGD